MSFNNTKTPTKPTCEAKWQVPQRPCNHVYTTKKGNKAVRKNMEYYLEGELKEKFCKLFPIHSNRRMMQWFGIGFSSLQRFKRELGLEKNMTKIRKELAADVKKICEENGYYDSLRGHAPTPQCREAAARLRATGYHPLTALKKKNPRKYKRVLQKRSEARKELIKSERRRVEYGLAPHTNLTPWLIGEVRKFTKPEISKRHNALKRGYILGDPETERYCIFYDKDTERALIFESNCTAMGFTLAPLPKDEPQAVEVPQIMYNNS